MDLCTPEQMRSIDRRTIESFGIAGFDLMERAGKAVVLSAERLLGGLAGKRVVILCGKGNNGGDGFVAGRILKQAGTDVRLLLFADQAAIRGDAATHLTLAEQAGVAIEGIEDGKLVHDTLQADLLIDALIGTGLNGPPTGLIAAGVRLINRSSAPVLAVDTPSGLTTGVGYPVGSEPDQWSCVKADRTVAIGLMKLDLALYPGRAWAGTVEIADIGFPEAAIREENLWLSYLDRPEMSRLLPGRTADAHKGDCGRVAVVAGSVGMTGAATLTSRAAMRAGAGMTLLGAPSSLIDSLASKLTEVMLRPLSETPGRTLSQDALPGILELAQWADALAIGPGLSRNPDTAELVRRVVTSVTRPLVIDADGLNAFAGLTSLLRDCPAEMILTPHMGELARLIDRTPEDILADRVAVARETAVALKATLVLKGASTLIAAPTGQVAVNSTGNPGMATAGSGDVLTGVIAGLLGQGLPPWDAARLGVFLHGLAGDIGVQHSGLHGLIAGDLIDQLPAAFLKVARS